MLYELSPDDIEQINEALEDHTPSLEVVVKTAIISVCATYIGMTAYKSLKLRREFRKNQDAPENTDPK